MKYLRLFLSLAAAAALVILPWLFDWRAGAGVLAFAVLLFTLCWSAFDVAVEKNADANERDGLTTQIARLKAEKLSILESYEDFLERTRRGAIWVFVASVASLVLLLLFSPRE